VFESVNKTVFAMPQITSIVFLTSIGFHIAHSPLTGVQSPMTILLFIYHRTSVVGIETRYRLDGPCLEPLWMQEILSSIHTSRPALGPSILLYNGYRVFFSGIKPPGHGVDHPP
jgi:hypothetical protein